MPNYVKKYTPIENKQERMRQMFRCTTPLPDPVAAIIVNYVVASEKQDGKDIDALHVAIKQFLKFIMERTFHQYASQITKLLQDQEEMEWWEWVSEKNPHYHLWSYIKYHQNVQPVVQRLKILIKDSPFGYSNDEDDFQLVKAAYYEDLNIPEPAVTNYPRSFFR